MDDTTEQPGTAEPNGEMGQERIEDARTFWELISRRGALSPARPMLLDAGDEVVTFGAFAARAEQVAAGLASLGVGAGTVVSWQLPTQVETVVLSAALSRLGAVQNPIIHLYREREVGFAIRQTGAELFVVPGQFRGFDYPALAARVVAGMERPPRIVVADAGWEGPPEVAGGIEVLRGVPEGDPATLPPPPAPAPSPARQGPIRWIYYTSGSTADPKGVRHTDQTLIAGGRGLAIALDMSSRDIGSIAFPYAHIGGPDYLVTMLALGFPAVLLDAFDVDRAIELFARNHVTMVGGSTAFYIAFLSAQRARPDRPVLPDLRLMSGGGAPKPPELHREVREEIGGRGVVHGYGMTEVPMISSGSPHDTDEQLANTDGRPVVGAEVRIVRLDGTPAAVGEEGEVRVRGPMVFHGYTDPSLDTEAFDTEGFFRTGDLGHLREDGHLVLTGRLKDVIVRKGENVSAKEVEDVIYRHPDVEDVAVIGLPDRARGERVCAVVQLRAGAERLTLPDVVEFCRAAGLMIQKIPEQLEVRTEMPRASTGKIVKKALREEYGS